jgi:hypothetical protein
MKNGSFLPFPRAPAAANFDAWKQSLTGTEKWRGVCRRASALLPIAIKSEGKELHPCVPTLPR